MPDGQEDGVRAAEGLRVKSVDGVTTSAPPCRTALDAIEAT